MKSFLIDINVVLDFLMERKPFNEPAKRIMNHAEYQRVNLYISAFSYNVIYFFLKKYNNSHKKAIEILSELNKITKIVDTTNFVIKESLISKFNDFEDAMQANSASSIPLLDGIITRNVSDFKNSKLPILMPEEALVLIN